MHARIERPLQQVSQVSAQSESTYHFPYSSSLTPPSPPLPLHSHTYHSHSQSHSFLSMDLAIEELQFLSVAGIVRESVRIPGQSHRIFGLITLTLITPLSLSILTHTLFTHPILRRLEASHSAADLAALIGTQFLYLTFLFLFSLLSTAAVVLSVASLYSSSKPPPPSPPSSPPPSPAPSPPRPDLPLRLPPHAPLQPPLPRIVLPLGIGVRRELPKLDLNCGRVRGTGDGVLCAPCGGGGGDGVGLFGGVWSDIWGVWGGGGEGDGGWGGGEGFGGRGLGWGLGGGQFGWVVGAECVLLCLQELPS
ncbi:hypothetical protein Syun_031659 [Stephania yunnanensis]|uniref:Uncharacterized protein n=1 Tax=Stephania yunnanensis TaxID=152371 RepID=A0AAP0DW46_9MAGN